ncbi:unnamed protein product [Cylindrotheca closterium]|uniref:Fe2OG dioxygenase domain-containing protein n=1 Tax=Cylindrotheca closterium TaxID=2856 RepID=A0AAD2CXV0_9STRA|nr:unnamed protein product [Cylindrotheca closterium]
MPRKNPQYDETVAAAETYSHSEDDDEEYDEEDSVIEAEEVPFWRQHLPAIMIAIVATVASHLWNQSQQQQSTLLKMPELSTQKHPHVNDYRRMANISFCPNEKVTGGKKFLKPMEFFIPTESYDTIVKYYQADDVEDDLYEQLQYSEKPMDPNLECLKSQKGLKYKGTSFYYQTPELKDIYPELDGPSSSEMSRKRRLQQPPLDFTGFAAKFVNLSPNPVLLIWDGKGGNTKNNRLVGEIPPFESLGTATMPGHSFHVTPIYDTSTALQRWAITLDNALVYYEPNTPEELKSKLTPEQYIKYQRQIINKAYARDYLISSKRTWLGHFPPRAPLHFMHSADYIGQQHKVGDFSLKVLSVAPRAFLIEDFLSPEDCQAVIQLSQEQGLKLSTLHTGATAKQTQDLSTRSSSNAWLPRDSNELTESIYSKAAQVMQLDPELFQKYHDSSAHHHSIAESLQVVRYKKNGEQYQSHHDFVYPSINHRYQPSRFATLLIYLNDVPKGGETRIPRALNNYNSKGLEIRPKAGQAVLFYNMLEDGNMDDLSQHGSNPTDGHEKWLANLWVWNPIIG